MKGKLPITLILILFAILTVVYFRHAIWSPTEVLMTRHLASDLYGHFLHVWNSLGLLGQGTIPVGDYWVQYGGGYPAALLDQLLLPQDLLLMLFYAITDSFTMALKLVGITFYFTTLVMAYWFGKVLFGRRDMSVILAIAYAFSAYGINQLEHPELLYVQPFILFTLIFLEKALRSNRLRHIIPTSLGLLLVGLSQLYPLYFLLIFVGLRLVFQLVTTQRRMETLYTFSKVGVLFLLTFGPFLLLQLNNMPSEQFVDSIIAPSLAWHSQPPSLYFLRDTAFVPYVPETHTMYLGLSVLMLALVPMILKHETQKLYLFHLLVAVLFMLYAVGQYGPLNLASWFRENMPFAFFIRVPGRALVIGYLSFAVCAAIGFGILIDKVRASRITTKPLIVVLAVGVIFADLTIGFEPPTMTIPPTTEGVYQFVREQPGDFRIIEIPSIHGQQATTPIYTGHDTLNPIAWTHGHFEPHNAFIEVYHSYVRLDITAQKAAMYGVKYVAVNTDPEYFDANQVGTLMISAPNRTQVQKVNEWLSNSENYGLVYSEEHVNVYENQEFWGLITSSGTDYLCWSREGPHTLIVKYDSKVPTTITVSQSYTDGWVATLDDEEKLPIHNFNSVQQIEVPAGNHSITLHYQSYENWIVVATAFYVALVAVILFAWKKRLWPIVLVCGIAVLTVSLTWDINLTLYQVALTALGSLLILAPIANLRRR